MPNSESNIKSPGYAIIDNALGEDWCSSFREEIELLSSMDLLTVSGNKLSVEREGKVYLHAVAKDQIHELDMILDGKSICKPEIWLVAENLKYLWEKGAAQIIQSLNSAYPDLAIDALDQMKIQFNEGNGGCFPMHFDSSQSTSKRNLTLLIYLNPDWNPEDGGQVRLYPLPYESVDVQPLNDRVVIFSSIQMLHRVLPCKSPRYLLSLWFSSSKPTLFPTKMRAEPGEEDLSSLFSFLFENNQRKMLSKVIYAKEWDESCIEAFGNNDHVKESMQTHWKEVKRLETNLNPDLLSLLKTYLPLKTK